MALSGKYDFRGIKKLGAAGLRTALGSVNGLGWFLKASWLSDFVFELLANWLANKGLIILNLGHNLVDTHFDQKQFDASLDDAFSKIQNKKGRANLTPDEIKKIDDEVINAARDFIVVAKPKP